MPNALRTTTTRSSGLSRADRRALRRATTVWPDGRTVAQTARGTWLIKASRYM